MNYLYHWVPKDMRGNVLYPLNILKDVHFDLYEKEVSKYNGREHIMQQRIPILDCLWNDVLHFSAVHPSLIKKALFESGRTKPFNQEYFEVDPHLLNPENTIVYLYKHSNMSDKLNEDNFAKFDPDNISQYSTMPEETKEYYKEKFTQKTNPLLFHGVPHILFKGSLDVSTIRKISV